jgi:uncharacterized membrane protein HdeD (DUF308 family)
MAMLSTLSRYWWVLALRGVVAIIFGVLAVIWPALTLFTLVLLFGAYAFVDGIFAVVAGISSRERDQRWWAAVLEGIAGIIFGVLTFFWPGMTALVLLYFIAAWALVTGVLEIMSAIRLRQVIDNEWTLILGGILSVIFGVVLFLFPGAGALGLTWLIGVYAIVFGIMFLVLAFRLRGMADTTGTTSAPGAAHI